MQPCSVPASNKMTLPQLIDSDTKPRSCPGELFCSSPTSQQWCGRSSSGLHRAIGLSYLDPPSSVVVFELCLIMCNVHWAHIYRRPECGYLDPAEFRSAPLPINSQLLIFSAMPHLHDFVDSCQFVEPWEWLAASFGSGSNDNSAWLPDRCLSNVANDFNEAVDNIDRVRNEIQLRTLLPKKLKCSSLLRSFKGGDHLGIFDNPSSFVLVWYPFETSCRRISSPELWLRDQFLQMNCRYNTLGLDIIAAPPKIGFRRSSNYIDNETLK